METRYTVTENVILNTLEKYTQLSTLKQFNHISIICCVFMIYILFHFFLCSSLMLKYYVLYNLYEFSLVSVINICK